MSIDAREPAGPRFRVMLPALLFLATCLSTFWTGAVDWRPLDRTDALGQVVTEFEHNRVDGTSGSALEQALAVARVDWRQGLFYMGVVMALLLAHEMGHFLMALRHRVPASLPYFIPLPIVPFGTLGAVIGMEGAKATRRQLFDLGVAGPLAGLAVALPVTWLGIRLLPDTAPAAEGICFHNPLLLQYMIEWLHPTYPTPAILYLNQFNPFLMAGWVGLLITGFNMLPVSQFDGGHVAYALMGRRAHWLARALVIAAAAFMVIADRYLWLLAFLLILLLGPDHPPTADDAKRPGWFRQAISWASLLIPIFCFPLWGVTAVGR